MADLNSTIVRGNLRVTEDINTNGSITFSKFKSAGYLYTNSSGALKKGTFPSMIKSVTIGLTQSLDSFNGSSQSIKHTANQEVVFDGYGNYSPDYSLDAIYHNISLKRTSDTNTNVYIQMYSSGGGFIDEGAIIYYHIVTYNS